MPRLDASRLTADGLRQRFAETRVWTPEPPVDLSGRFSGDPRKASVLIPLVDRADGLTVLLTERSPDLSNHAGQIAFPGGRQEAFDVDAVATALREAEEEVGLALDRVEVLGVLPEFVTGTGFAVTPVAALVHPPFELTIDPSEVAEAFEVPLAFLMNPANHETRSFRWEGGARTFFSMPYPRADGAGAHFVWGATAAMLRNLYHFLAA